MEKFKPHIKNAVKNAIEAKLSSLEQDHSVRIIFAVESGSRAWGFPSTDSDYDVRFIYVHEPSWYLSLKPGRDVIELPIEDDLDINGWDLKKALNLLLKPNPVLLEWLSSPIRYRWDENSCDRFMSLVSQIAHNSACFNQYRSIGIKQLNLHTDDNNMITAKKYLYAVRSALAVQWTIEHPETPPPMNLQALAGGLRLSPTLLSTIEQLVVAKTVYAEKTRRPRVAEIDEFLNQMFTQQPPIAEEFDHSKNYADASDLFRELVGGKHNRDFVGR